MVGQNLYTFQIGVGFVKFLLSIVLSVALSVVSVLYLIHNTPQVSPTSLYFSQLKQATYMVTGDRGACSGVLIEPHRLLTAAHCVAVSEGEDFNVAGKPAHIVKLGDMHDDFMLLDVDAVCPCVPVAPGNAKAGDHLYVVGYPFGAGVQFVTEGWVMGVMQSDSRFVPEEVNGYMMTNTPIWPGNSGGGVFELVDGQWYVVTVVSRGVSGLGVFPSSQQLHKFLSK
jgi:S1-C subfamily serine protease